MRLVKLREVFGHPWEALGRAFWHLGKSCRVNTQNEPRGSPCGQILNAFGEAAGTFGEVFGHLWEALGRSFWHLGFVPASPNMIDETFVLPFWFEGVSVITVILTPGACEVGLLTALHDTTSAGSAGSAGPPGKFREAKFCAQASYLRAIGLRWGLQQTPES